MATGVEDVGINTSLVTVLSSSHGRQRREERDITKRDLQRQSSTVRKKRCRDVGDVAEIKAAGNTLLQVLYTSPTSKAELKLRAGLNTTDVALTCR
jgi:hypothetical protein